MSKEKQIEEMIEHVREVTDDCQNCNLYKDRLCDYNCDLCEAIQLACEALYNAGYRKQSEADWKAYPDEHEICATEFVCSNCKESFCTNEMTDWEFIETMKYCPNCGAKMKGGAKYEKTYT